MGAEDSSSFRQIVPGFLFRLGSGDKSGSVSPDGHAPEFDIDEDCLLGGVKAMSGTMLDSLDRHAEHN